MSSIRIELGYSIPPPPDGTRATERDGKGNGPNRLACWVIARRNTGISPSRSAALGAPTRSFTPLTVVSDTANGPTATLTSRAVSIVECQVLVAPLAAGSGGSPDMITLSAAGAVTVRSVCIASLVALSAVNLIIGSVCQPYPRSQASSGCAEPNHANRDAPRPARPNRSNESSPRVRLNPRSAVTVVPAGTGEANGMRSKPPCVDGSAPSRAKVGGPAPWSAFADVTTILLPAATVGPVLAVSRKTSSVIGRSGVNSMCSLPCTLVRSGLTVNARRTLGRFGSGAA